MSEKKRFNLLDALIVLLAAAILFVGVLVLTSRAGNGGEETDGDTMTVVLEVKEQYGAFEKMLNRGETLCDNIQNEKFGVLEDYEIVPCEKTVISQVDGSVMTVEVPDRYDFHLTLRVPTEEKIVVGKNLSIKAKLYKCSGYVIDIENQAETDIENEKE